MPDAYLEYAVLGALHEHGPMTAGQLSRTFRTDVTDTLKALREGGAVVEADGEPGVWRVTTTGERGDDDD